MKEALGLCIDQVIRTGLICGLTPVRGGSVTIFSTHNAMPCPAPEDRADVSINFTLEIVVPLGPDFALARNYRGVT